MSQMPVMCVRTRARGRKLNPAVPWRSLLSFHLMPPRICINRNQTQNLNLGKPILSSLTTRLNDYP